MGIILALLIAGRPRHRRIRRDRCGSCCRRIRRSASAPSSGAGVSCDDGDEVTKLQPVGGVCAESRGRGAVLRVGEGHPGLDHAHDHRCDRRRRLVEPTVGRAVGRRPPSRVGVGTRPSRALRIMAAATYWHRCDLQLRYRWIDERSSSSRPQRLRAARTAHAVVAALRRRLGSARSYLVLALLSFLDFRSRHAP